jgi:phosphatidylserine/phosphatidylglycerophosphate/cardiolipin synthase-like enzyme
MVREAGRLFDADVKRHSYEACSNRFLVSPVNARRQLAAFLKSAKKELLIYDPEVSDRAMIEILQGRMRAKVDVRIIGKVSHQAESLPHGRLSMRLHTRTILVDGKAAFVGSQSLRELELDSRREIGVICRDAKIVSRIREIFEEDWAAVQSKGTGATAKPVAKVAKKVAKAVAAALPPVAPALQEVIRDVVGDTEVKLDTSEVETLVREAVKDAVKEVVRNAVGEASASNEPVK